MATGGHQGFQQHIAVLITGAGITETALLIQQVEARATALPREITSIQTHQHDHLVGNGAHRFQGTHREGPTAMPKATAVH